MTGEQNAESVCGCSNCGEPIAAHCCTHLVPHCPGKCPDLDLAFLGVVVLCGDCGAEGPERPRSMAALQAAREAGWSRCYRGSGEVWRCPPCRAHIDGSERGA